MKSGKKCDKCGTMCQASARFCLRCRNPLSEATRTRLTCPKGHKLDPSWSDCPFCRSTATPLPTPTRPPGPSRVRTMVDLSAAGPAAELPPPAIPEPAPREVPTPAAPQPASAAAARRVPAPAPAARREPSPAPAAGRVPAPAAPRPPVSRDKTRLLGEEPPMGAGRSGKIVGVLVTFSHQASGHAFLIRVGRNVLGSHTGADIRVRDDAVSDKHAVFLGTESGVVLDDCLSTNGTFVNQRRVEDKTPLRHGDVVRTGNTLWRFARIEPPESPAAD